MQHITQQIEEPPQGPIVPPYTPIILSIEDADAFYQNLEQVRTALAAGTEHYLKKDRDLKDLIGRNCQMVGIKDEYNNIVAGALVVMPVTREVARKNQDYPWEAKSDKSALLSALWTHKDHTGNGYAKAIVGKVIGMAREKEDIIQVMTGVAEGNGVRKIFEDAHKFRHLSAKVNRDHGNLMNYFTLDVRYR